MVVDDERPIVELIKFNLEKEGFTVEVAYDGEAALQMINADPPHLVVLDIMLPKVNGLDICRALRSNQRTANLPVIFLTAKGEETDKVIGLELGADDYLTKPFSPRELVARVRAVLRRVNIVPEKPQTGQLFFQEISMDLDRHEVFVRGEKISLSPKEFELLRFFLENPGKVFSREFLLDHVWGYDFAGDTRTVDVHVRYLRQKIETNPNQPQYILTVRGFGYKLKEREK